MKIVFFINSLKGGGAERVVSRLANYFVNKYDVYVILLENEIDYELTKNINIISLNEKSNISGVKKLFRLPILAYKLSEITKENRFTKIISFLTRANYINILASIFSTHQTVINERAQPSLQYKSGMNGIINKFLIKLLYKKANLVLSNSFGNKVDLENNFKINNVKYMYNLFDLEKIKNNICETANIKKDKFTFVTVGRLDAGKNHLLLIEAIKDVDANLWIIGAGELENFLKSKVKQLKLEDKIIFLGFQKNPFKLMSKADCFVFGSNHEGFPNVLVEAMACELPVISTDCPSGPREILAPSSDFTYQLKDEIELAEFGILIPVNDIKYMTKAMNMTINNQDLKEKYKKQSIKRANDFGIDKIIKQWEKFI